MNYDKYLENEKDTETAVTMGVIYPVAEGEFNLPTSILKRKALISSHYRQERLTIIRSSP